MKEAKDEAVAKRRKFTGITIVALAALFFSAGGAFAQTVYNVLNSPYNARCDGFTDDTVALQGALNSAAGTGTVLIPAGASCVTRMLLVPSNTRLNIEGRLQGSGGSSSCPSCDGAILFVGIPPPSPVIVENVRIWGGGVVDANKAANSGISSRNAANVTVEGGLTITNSYYWPVNMQSTTGVHLTDLLLSNGGASSECAGDGTTGQYTTDCHVNRVTVRSNSDGCFSFYGGVKNSSITNSDLSGCLGIQVVSDGGQPLPNDNILIQGNKVHDNPQGYGIEVLSWLVHTFQTHVTIDHNEVWNIRGGGIALADGAQNSIVSFNIVHDDTNDPNDGFTGGFVGGIVAKSGTASITNNTIYNEGGTYPGTGIVFGNIDCVDTVTVSGNSISNLGGGPQPLKDAFAGLIGHVAFGANTISGGVDPTPKRAPQAFLNGSWACYSFGLPGDIAFSGDLRGNQIPLNMVYRPSEANWYINLVNGADWTPATTQVVQFGLPAQPGQLNDIPELVYYQGRAHIAVYRPSTRQTLVNTTNDTYNGSNVLVLTGYPVPLAQPAIPPTKPDGAWPRFNFGWRGDVPFEMRLTPGGPLSPVVYRPSEANWYVATGRTGYPVPADVARVVQFGFPGDTPRVVSYNGVDHIAVLRGNQLLVNTDNLSYHGSNVLVWTGP